MQKATRLAPRQRRRPALPATSIGSFPVPSFWRRGPRRGCPSANRTSFAIGPMPTAGPLVTRADTEWDLQAVAGRLHRELHNTAVLPSALDCHSPPAYEGKLIGTPLA